MLSDSGGKKSCRLIIGRHNDKQLPPQRHRYSVYHERHLVAKQTLAIY